ncbi:MAG TPA: ribokinase [Anditalea sp.]|nr:ribokinase [Anditalea sp.]
MKIPIYVIGSSNTDMVVKADKLPSPGETVLGGEFLMNPGGKGANQAVTAARLGSHVTFVAKVGKDLFGKQALQQFQNENIDTEFISTDIHHPSGVALIGVDNKGQNNIIVAPGANSHMDVRVVEQALSKIEDDAIILLQLEIPIDIVEFAIDFGYRKGLKVILNPAPVQKINPEILKQLFVITPNEFEAEMLTGIEVCSIESAKKAAEVLYAMGITNVVITLGSRGGYLHNHNTSKLIAAPMVTAIDTTAAGDCFNGALAVAISENLDLEPAVEFACKAASISVTRMGAQSSLPYRKEVNEIVLVPYK